MASSKTRPKPATKKPPRKRVATTQARRKRITAGPGRPKVIVDPEALRPLVMLGCTHEEIADALRIARSTFQLRLSEDDELRAQLDQWRAVRKKRLRAWLSRAAERGNARVLIHLAERELGHRRIRAVELSGRGGGALELNTELRPVLEKKLAEFLRSRRGSARPHEGSPTS